MRSECPEPLATCCIAQDRLPLRSSSADPFVTPDEHDVSIGKAIANVLGGSHPYSSAVGVIGGTFDTLGIPHEIQGETVSARDGFGNSITLSVEGGRFRCDIHKPGARTSS